MRKDMKHQGDMQAPKLDPKADLKHKGPQHKEPAFKQPSAEMVKSAPANKGNALPLADAPPGVAGVNGGDSMALPKPHTLRK